MKPMRRIRTLFLVLALLIGITPTSLSAQTYFAALPNAQIQFFDSNGNPLAGGKLYAYQAGTTTPQDTYTDSTGNTANANPVILDSAGRAAIWLASTNPYKLVLKTSADVTVWTQDQVSDFGSILKRDLATSFATKSLDGEKLASQYTAANAGAQFGLAIADVPSSGGRVSGTGIGGGTISSNFFSGVTKPVILEWGAGTYTISTDVTVPSNVSLIFDEGTVLSINSGKTLTISGGVVAPFTQIFSGSGTVTFNTTKVAQLYPQWWGALGDNSHNDATAINAALAAATQPKIVYFTSGNFKSSSSLIVPTGVRFDGGGKGSKVLATDTTHPTTELVRLQGDYASISNVWLSGSGQVANSVDQRRGIWIGCGTVQTVTCVTSHNLVENVTIDQFVGNGIAGDFTYAKIVHNTILNTTDSGIFLQPTCNHNLVDGNTIQGTKYSGLDVNGSDNRIVNNDISGNGGGSSDTNSQSGVLIAWISSSLFQPHANRNIVESNRIDNNNQAGVYLYVGGTTSGIVNSLGGNIIRGNIITGHTNAYNENAGVTLDSWNGGIVVLGGNNTLIDGNTLDGNTFNIVVAGISNNTSPGVMVTNNQSFNAVTNAAMTGLSKPSGVGYFFPGAARLDAVGGSPATSVTLTNNQDWYPAAECYRWSLDGAVGLVWSGWTITGNKCNSAGTYGFRVVDPNSFGANFVDGSNYATGAATANYSGFNALGLTANSTHPSVANATSVVTQNSNPTTITTFDDGAYNQHLIVRVGDTNTTFDFTGSHLKGNAGVDFSAYTGDFLDCTSDGTDWYCATSTQAVTGGYANGVMQAPTTQGSGSGKATTVAPTVAAVRTRITMDGAALNAGVTVSFTLTNALITANSRLDCKHFNAGTIGAYTVNAFPAAGSATVAVRNVTAGNLSEAIQLDCRLDATQ